MVVLVILTANLHAGDFLTGGLSVIVYHKNINKAIYTFCVWKSHTNNM